jgi:hypothetical protein
MMWPLHSICYLASITAKRLMLFDLHASISTIYQTKYPRMEIGLFMKGGLFMQALRGVSSYN